MPTTGDSNPRPPASTLSGSADSRRSGAPRAFQAPRLACSSRVAQRVARLLLVLLAVMIVAMLLAPWRQTVTGGGRVVAFSPMVREQTIEVPVSGRIHRFAADISEGMRVKQGDFIAEIRDLDPELLTRLEDQLAAKQREMEATQEIVAAYTGQVRAFETVREETVAAADEYVKMAEQKRLAERRNLDAADAALAQETLDYERQAQLEKDGLASTLKLQTQERKLKEAEAKVDQAKAYVAAADNEIEAKKRERSAKEREAQTKIDSARAALQKAVADFAKLEKEVLESRVKLAQQQNQIVTAPIDGFVFRVHSFQGGQIAKQGEPLLTIVPDTADRAVELWLDGNDAPLVSVGRHVRMQFEGWPAVQFSGWPAVAVGSFGGKVASIDATDDGKGKFRILVLPDEDDKPWPSERFLRQGVKAHGWVLLEEVSLGFEIWRQLNAFPPVVDVDEPIEKGGKGVPLKKGK